MPWLLLLVLVAQASAASTVSPATGNSRPPDIVFKVQMIDPGFSESVAVADFNKDGRPDILSAEYWYEARGWTKHRIREIPFTGGTSTISATCPWTWTASSTSFRSRISRGGLSGSGTPVRAAGRG
jgi:FG-GAP repeat